MRAPMLGNVPHQLLRAFARVARPTPRRRARHRPHTVAAAVTGRFPMTISSSTSVFPLSLYLFFSSFVFISLLQPSAAPQRPQPGFSACCARFCVRHFSLRVPAFLFASFFEDPERLGHPSLPRKFTDEAHDNGM